MDTLSSEKFQNINSNESNTSNTSNALRQELTSDLNGLSMDDLESLVSNYRQRMHNYGIHPVSDIPRLDNYVLKSEFDPERFKCTVDKADDRDAYIPKSAVPPPRKCQVPEDFNLNDYVKKSNIPPEKVCPPPQEPDMSLYVKKSTIPPTQKCPPCNCPNVKVSAGLCKTCPPPPKCPAPAPCPTVNCPEPKACPPQKYCPAPKPCSREKEIQVKYVQVPTVIQQRDPNSMALLQSNNRANSKP
jgi:hypothetical protein